MERISSEQASYRLQRKPLISLQTRLAVVAGTALVALCAHIAVPLGFTPVPMTMQTFAVLLLGLLLEPVPAFACLALYLGEGLAGMPVFSPHGPGGIAQLLGPTGGYLLSYPFAAALASTVYRRFQKGFSMGLVAAALGSFLILAVGGAWLGLLTHAKFSVLFAQSITPFLPGDAIKVFATAACAGVLGSISKTTGDRSI